MLYLKRFNNRINQTINNKIVQNATGIDRMFYKVKSCHFHPINQDQRTSLTNETEEKLLSKTNRFVQLIYPRIKEKISYYNLTLKELTDRMFEELIDETSNNSNDEFKKLEEHEKVPLVHSAYMMEEEIIIRIVKHVVKNDH